MSFLKRLFGRDKKNRATITLAATRGYSVDIVGEASYQRNIERVAGPKKEWSAKLKCMAVLECEEQNPHDKNAVLVKIDERIVGYLSRDYAQRYRNDLSAIDRTLPLALVQAKVVGGWKNEENEGHFGVKLNLKLPLVRTVD